jgi:hypothetical protein
VLDEVHLYTNYSSDRDKTITIEIPLASIQKIEEIKFDKKRTTRNHVIGGIVIAGSAIAIISLISVASSLSTLAAW